MNEELLRKLYDKYGLSSKGTFETFASDMQDEGTRKKIYDKYLSGKGTFDQFESDLGVSKASVGDYVGAGISNFNRGISKMVSTPLKFIGQGGKGLQSLVTGQDVVGDDIFTQAGQGVEDFTNKINPRYDNVNQTFQNVAEGLGQGVGMIVTSGMSAPSVLTQTATKVPSILQATSKALAQTAKQAISPVGLIGGSISAVPEWEAAKAAGVSDEEAFGVLLKNYAFGQATEPLPVQNLLGRLNKLTGNKILNTVKAMGTGAVEEGTQEAVQQYLTNEVARKSYDPKRDPLFSILESAKVGGIVGFLLPGMVAAAKHLPVDKREAYLAEVDKLRGEAVTNQLEAEERVEKKKEAEVQINKAIESVQVDPIVAAQQDAIISETNDTKNDQGIPSEIGKGQEPIQTQPVQESSDQTPETSGILQAPETQVNNEETPQTQERVLNTPIQREINTDTGVTREKSPVTSDEYILLKKQIRDFARGFNQGKTEGVKEGSKEYQSKVREFSQLVSDSLSGTKRVGDETIKIPGIQLSERQQNQIVKRMGKVSLHNQRSVDSFLNYLGKTIQDTKYDEKLSDTEQTISKIKGRIKSLPAAVQSEVKRFIQTPTDYVNIDTHQEIANKIANSLSQPGTKNYKPLNITDVTDYNNRTRQEITTQRNQELAQDLNTPIGDSEFTPEEIDRILSDEDIDPFEDNATEARKKQVTDALKTQAEYSRIGLDNSVVSSPVESKVLGAMKSLPLDRLTPKELKAYIKAVDNAIVNGDYSGAGWILAKDEAFKGAERLKNVKALDVVSSLEGIGSLLTPAMMTKAIFGTSERAAMVNKNTGVSETYAGYSRTENRISKLEDGYTKLVKELDNRHGGDVRSHESIVRQGIAAYLVRYKSDPIVELAQRKQDLRESIERTKTLDPETGAIAEKIFNQFSEEKSQEAILSKLQKVDIKSAKVLDFFINEYSGIVDELATNTEVMYNEPFVKEFNYTPVTLKSIGEGIAIDELGDRQGMFQTSAPLKPKRATTTIEATGRIPQDRILDLDFGFNMIKRYKDSVYDIETAIHKLQVREFAKLPESNHLFATDQDKQQTNKENFYKYYNLVEQENRGKSPFERDAFSSLNKAMAIGKDISFSMLFGDPLKFFTQYAPGALNTMINLGPDSFLQARPTQARAVIEQYPIGKRGERLGQTDFGDKIFNASAFQVLGRSTGVSAKFDKAHEALKKLKQGVAIGFIKGDVWLARRAWTAAYTKYLTDKGIKVDWKTEANQQQDPMRQEAAAYAEQFVNENMGVNQSSQYAKALKASSGAKRFLMDIVFPLSGYPINMKTRMIENYKFMAIGDEKARNEAIKNQFGTISEAVLYSALTYFLISTIWGGVQGEITDWAGLDSPDNEEQKDQLRSKLFATSIANDLNPIVTGDALNFIWGQGLNRFSYMMREDEDQLYKDWSEEAGESFATFDKSGLTANMGIYSILGRNFEPSLQYMFQIQDDELVTDTNRYPLSPEQMDFIEFNAWVQLFQSFGIGVPFVSKQLDVVRREQIKMAKSQ